MKIDHKKDKALLINLSEALNISKTHIRKDDLNYWTISGKMAWIDTDGEYWYIHIGSDTERQWSWVKKSLSWLELRIDGDYEGVLRSNVMPDEIQARIIRKLLRLRTSYTPSNFTKNVRLEGVV